MQIFTVNITWVVWPHVSNVLNLRYLCEHNPLFLSPKKYLFFGEYFCPTYFSYVEK